MASKKDTQQKRHGGDLFQLPWRVSRLASFLVGQMSGWRRRSWEAEREISSGKNALQKTWEHHHFDMFSRMFSPRISIEVWEVYGKMGKCMVSLLGVHGEILNQSLVTDGYYKG